ncbi:hypothetical protein ACWOAH_01035 [Vagococcus vulneris]|uniref:Uncharacterized protein n=2 Tax=Vagococcus vulneris TaxID=1977869 RepID=A0A430A242_9ENTE|nr:hypothetical protein CBF37_00505 [Vagococcus vulneris]
MTNFFLELMLLPIFFYLGIKIGQTTFYKKMQGKQEQPRAVILNLSFSFTILMLIIVNTFFTVKMRFFLIFLLFFIYLVNTILYMAGKNKLMDYLKKYRSYTLLILAMAFAIYGNLNKVGLGALVLPLCHILVLIAGSIWSFDQV